MSRIGKLPITIPSNIKVSASNEVLTFDNGKVKKEYTVSKGVKIDLDSGIIKLSALDKNTPKISMFVGMDRSNINNIIKGMQSPFKTTLEYNGVGYKALVEKNLLVLTLGYSHEIVYALPKGIAATIEKPNLIVISGEDKVLVGQIAAEIISFRKPEPYKGKGVKLAGKAILRKESKKK